MTQLTPDGAGELLLPVAAVARRLGVAPATLRTWDRRYGLGPSVHAPGAHRRVLGRNRGLGADERDLLCERAHWGRSFSSA